MQPSIHRILTTHSGSLPRPVDLATTLEALDTGTLSDPAAFNERMRRSVTGVVQWQAAAGVDILSDARCKTCQGMLYIQEVTSLRMERRP